MTKIRRESHKFMNILRVFQGQMVTFRYTNLPSSIFILKVDRVDGRNLNLDGQTLIRVNTNMPCTELYEFCPPKTGRARKSTLSTHFHRPC